MGAFLMASRLIDVVNQTIGKLLYWLVLIMVLVSSTNAVIRKVFDTSSNAWLELQWYLFSAVFMGCAGYDVLHNEHIRIDIVNAQLSKTTRNWIEIAGLTLFLIPLCGIMLYECWPYFYSSLLSGEQSSNAGGLIRWPVRFLMVFGFALLLIQAISELIKRIAVMRGLIPEPHDTKASPH